MSILSWKLDNKWKVGYFKLYERGSEHLGLEYRTRHDERNKKTLVKSQSDMKKMFPSLEKDGTVLRRIDRLA